MSEVTGVPIVAARDLGSPLIVLLDSFCSLLMSNFGMSVRNVTVLRELSDFNLKAHRGIFTVRAKNTTHE